MEIVTEYATPPEPWVEGRTIPWGDPAFSARMLAAHLDQSVDAASRRFETIDKHVEFIAREALPGAEARVLDLGCGPGLYTSRLATRGHECLGIDIGPAVINYAKNAATPVSDRCRYVLGDMREAHFEGDYDLIMILFGELNPFPRDDALSILRRCRAALAPSGRILIEVHAFEAVRDRGISPPRWSAHSAGLFSDEPHLRLDQQFWLEQSHHAVGRHWIVDAESGETSRYGWSMRAYTDDEYMALLTEAGLKLITRYENLTGDNMKSEFPVLLAAPV